MEEIVYKIGIITVSDKGAAGEREDTAAKEIEKVVSKIGNIERYTIIPDEIEEIKAALIKFIDEYELDLILTTGGTGFSKRDNTPEATSMVIERNAPGISEFMRMKSMSITKNAMLSRGVSGIRKNSLIINLPGSPSAAKECLEFIIDSIPHGLEILKGTAKECAKEC